MDLVLRTFSTAGNGAQKKKNEKQNKMEMTHQIEGCSQDGGVRDCARLAAVEQELKTLHALTDGAQVDHVLVLHGLLAGSQALLEAMRSWRRGG